jgi:hypothetical protein
MSRKKGRPGVQSGKAQKQALQAQFRAASEARAAKATPSPVTRQPPFTPTVLEELAAIQASRQELVVREEQLVEEAREMGATWEEIGTAMGLRRQAVWIRYGKDR